MAQRESVTRQTIIALEANRYSLSLAFRIARVFNTTLEDVFQYDGDSKGAGMET